MLKRRGERGDGGLAVLGQQSLDGSEDPWRELAGEELTGKNVHGRVLAATTDVDVGTAMPGVTR